MSDIASYIKNLSLEMVWLNGADYQCPVSTGVLADAIERLVAAPGLTSDEEASFSRYLLRLAEYHAFRLVRESRCDDPLRLVQAIGSLNRRFRLATRELQTFEGMLVNLAVALKQHREAFELFCIELVPRNTSHTPLLFNIACVGACHGMTETALKALSRASDKYYPLGEIENDSDLESLRETPAYRGMVAQRRYLDAKDPDFEALLSTLETLAACRFLTRKGADVVSHRAADFFYRKTLKPEQIRRFILAWLDHALSLPFLPEEHHYVALASIGTLAVMSEAELADRIMTSLISRDTLRGYEACRAAEAMAALGDKKIAYDLFCRAMAGEVPLSHVIETHPALSKLYREDERFRNVADRCEAEKNAMKAYLLEEPDPNDFSAVFKAAETEFYHVLSCRRKERITALARFRGHPQRERIAAFLRAGFDDLRHRRLTHADLVDADLFDALVCTIADFQDPGFIPHLIGEFTFVTDDDAEEEDGILRQYELNQVAGSIAVALSALGYDGSAAFMEPFLESYEWRYRGEDFIMKTRYGKWMIEKNSAAALAWLAYPQSSKGAAWAVAALADLGAVHALPVIRERLNHITNPVVLEAFKEGIARIEKGITGIVPWHDRMVRLFGVITHSEMANGAESDNVFLARAIAATGNPLLALVVEADDAGAKD